MLVPHTIERTKLDIPARPIMFTLCTSKSPSWSLVKNIPSKMKVINSLLDSLDVTSLTAHVKKG